MKIAICFSGQPRNICQKIYDKLYENLLSKYECDIYAHFWYDNETNYIGKTSYWVDKRWTNISMNVITLFKNLYNPKKIIYEKPLIEDIPDVSNIRYTGVTYVLYSFYTSIYKVINLIDDITKYDYIIRLRTDLDIIEIPKLINMNKNIIYVKTIYGGSPIYPYIFKNTENLDDDSFKTKFLNEGIGVDNAMIITNIKNKELFNIIGNYMQYYNNGTLMNDETMFYSHLKNFYSKYDIRIYNTDKLKHHILRE